MSVTEIFSSYLLTNKVALITGGAGLLGKQHAAALLDSGAQVVLADINNGNLQSAKAELAQKYAANHIDTVVMDVADLNSVKAAHEALLAKHKQVNILINNAAIDPKVSNKGVIETSRVENFPLEQWDLQLDVGLKGAFVCSQIFGTWMAKHNGGVILNIASDLSVIAPDQRLYRKNNLHEDEQPVKPITYSVIKTGLIGMTRYLAAYWANKNVRVNALSPGGVYVDQPEEFVQKLTQLIPMARMADANEYRAAVQFLCSDASRYMTGQNIVIDGGRSIL